MKSKNGLRIPHGSEPLCTLTYHRSRDPRPTGFTLVWVKFRAGWYGSPRSKIAMLFLASRHNMAFGISMYLNLSSVDLVTKVDILGFFATSANRSKRIPKKSQVFWINNIADWWRSNKRFLISVRKFVDNRWRKHLHLQGTNRKKIFLVTPLLGWPFSPIFVPFSLPFRSLASRFLPSRLLFKPNLVTN